VRADLDGLALGLGDGSPLAALDGPWEVCDGNNEEGVAVSRTHVNNLINPFRVNVFIYILNRLKWVILRKNGAREGLPVIRNTSQCVVPCQERGEESEVSTSLDQRDVVGSLVV
jgi:hypothetical protein